MTAHQTDENYWKEYDGLQTAKHNILSEYLKAWYPILSSWSARVLYIDSHAGRGRHDSGEEGSPILALKTLLDHKSRDQILQNSEVNFIFFEINEENYKILLEEIESLGELPNNIKVFPVHSDYDEELSSILDDIDFKKQSLIPTFAFIDPYGFTLSMDIFRRLLSFRACELFINIMYRYIDMARTNDSMIPNLDILFGDESWKKLNKITDHNKRIRNTIEIFSNNLGAKHTTPFYMYGSNNSLKYILLHATNHDRGKTAMKDAMWKVRPNGTHAAIENDNPDQLILFEEKPDLGPLEKMLWENFDGEDVKMEELYEWLLYTIYRRPHLHNVIKNLEKKGEVTLSDYGHRKAFCNNPTISFCKK